MADAGMNDNTFSMLTHLSPFAGYVIPFGNIIAPLIMWQVKKDNPFLESVGREALNFQITVMLAILACVVGSIATLGIGLIVLGPMMGLIAIADIVFIVIAAIEANKGNAYRFPICLRLVQGPGGPPAA